MNEAQARDWVGRLESQLIIDSPDEIIKGMASLVMMRDQIAPALYVAIRKTMASTLLVKLMKEEAGR